jgi:Zn-dependent protease/CBS domain-containing protein
VQLTQIAALFLCVTLHEYGHAMMARQFKVRTVDITLLPIGGLARLERMPRIPWQELLVAVAGPAVNVVIAALVAVGMTVAAETGVMQPIRVGSWGDVPAALVMHPVGWLLVMNIMLVVFNMIPAFPMDGGRVLRALLAMVWEYRLATRAAARIGMFAAIGLGMWGLYNSLPVAVLISLFIGYAGWAEARQVEMSEAIRGVQVSEGLVRNPATVHASDSLAQIVEFFSHHRETTVPVVGVNEYYLGMLDIQEVGRAVSGRAWQLTAADLMRSDAVTIKPGGFLDRQITGGEGGAGDAIPVVSVDGRLQGVVDLRSLAVRVALHRATADQHEGDREPITAVLVENAPAGSMRDTYY